MHLNQFRGLCSLAFCVLLCTSAASHAARTLFTFVSSEPISHGSQLTGDEEKVKGLFTRRAQMEPSMAYETSFFKDLVARQKSENKKLEHQDDIKKLNEELARVEAEKAKGDNPKLNEKAIKLQKEKAHYEIQDAAVLSYYTQSEYDQLTIQVSQAYAASKGRIETRSMIYDEIQYLFAQSEEQMKNAAETMASGYSMKDEIDRSNNGRLSFAMEALGIEQLNQILEIIGELDMLLTYSNDQLLEMKNGHAVGEGRGTVTVLEKPEETIEVTLSAPVADVVKIEEQADEKMAEPAQASVHAEAIVVAKEVVAKPEVTYSQPEEKKPVENKKQTTSPVKKSTIMKSKSEFKCQSVSDVEGTFFTVQVGSFNKELSDLSAYRKLSGLYLDHSDGVHYRYTTGQFTNADEAIEFAQSLHAKGFPDAFVTAVSEGERSTVQRAKDVLGQRTR